MHRRLEHMKETLMCAVENQMYDLSCADTKELGEAIDMIKDLEEAIYYCTITEAMKTEKSGHHLKDSDRMYFMDDMEWDEEETWSEYYGRSPHSRKNYIEAKMHKKDKATQLRELEKYMQELSSDIVEMIDDSSPEEKQYLEKKITTLASKIG